MTVEHLCQVPTQDSENIKEDVAEMVFESETDRGAVGRLPSEYALTVAHLNAAIVTHTRCPKTLSVKSSSSMFLMPHP